MRPVTQARLDEEFIQLAEVLLANRGEVGATEDELQILLDEHLHIRIGQVLIEGVLNGTSPSTSETVNASTDPPPERSPA